MIFNSIDFILFFCAVYAFYLILDKKPQNYLLLAASYFFYAWWDWRFTILIFITTAVDFLCSLAIDKTESRGRKKFFLLTSAVVDLSILGFFKYFNFFADSAVELLTRFGFSPDPITLQIILPVGISFYTFQSMSYTIDVYRGNISHTANFLEYALYVSFFPQLVAGPIERASHLIPQVKNRRVLTQKDFLEGSWLILFGFFKKVVVADNLAVIADEVFNNPGEHHGFAILLGVYAFAWQIYGDFSGYSNIARGVSRLMGFDLMVNFRMPYWATNPQDFWRRWHISLSTWLRDYLYISLGGNRRGPVRTYRNLFLTMLLGGLWHGAAWNFVIWGAYQGLLLIIHRLIVPPGKRDTLEEGGFKPIRLFVFFHLVCVGWFFFRINSIADFPILMSNLASFDFAHWAWALDIVFIVWPLVLIDLLQERKRDMYAVLTLPTIVRIVIYCLLFAYICVWGKVDGNEFIYFQF